MNPSGSDNEVKCPVLGCIAQKKAGKQVRWRHKCSCWNGITFVDNQF